MNLEVSVPLSPDKGGPPVFDAPGDWVLAPKSLGGGVEVGPLLSSSIAKTAKMHTPANSASAINARVMRMALPVGSGASLLGELFGGVVKCGGRGVGRVYWAGLLAGLFKGSTEYGFRSVFASRGFDRWF